MDARCDSLRERRDKSWKREERAREGAGESGERVHLAFVSLSLSHTLILAVSGFTQVNRRGITGSQEGGSRCESK